MGRLKDKVAIITGGGQGVGLGVAQAFAAEGASIVLTGRDGDKLSAVVPDLEARGGQVAVIAGNVRVRADAQAAIALAIDRFGGLDILVNNAQSSVQGVTLEDHDDETIATVVESGLYGTIYHMQAALPHLRARGGGSIINFGSRQGMYGAPGYSVYAAAKEAIRGLTRAAAREWGEYAIRVNVISPAAITPSAQEFLDQFPEVAAKNLELIALRRWGRPLEDIGPVAVFLASDDSVYVSGQTINVDGGMQML